MALAIRIAIVNPVLHPMRTVSRNLKVMMATLATLATFPAPRTPIELSDDGGVAGRLASSDLPPRSGRKVGVQPRERVPQPPFEDNLAVIVALGRELARDDLRPMADLPPDALEPSECGLFDNRFGDTVPGHRAQAFL